MERGGGAGVRKCGARTNALPRTRSMRASVWMRERGAPPRCLLAGGRASAASSSRVARVLLFRLAPAEAYARLAVAVDGEDAAALGSLEVRVEDDGGRAVAVLRLAPWRVAARAPHFASRARRRGAAVAVWGPPADAPPLRARKWGPSLAADLRELRVLAAALRPRSRHSSRPRPRASRERAAAATRVVATPPQRGTHAPEAPSRRQSAAGHSSRLCAQSSRGHCVGSVAATWLCTSHSSAPSSPKATR